MVTEKEEIRKGKNSEDTRKRILNAALKAFAEDGFEGARVDRIAEIAGVNKAMLYYYVGGKEALYEAVLMDNFERFSEELERASKSGKGPEDRMQKVLDALIRTLNEIPEHRRIMARELSAGATHLPKKAVEHMARAYEVVRNILDEGKKDGVFRDVNPMLAHLSIIGSTVFLIASGPVRQRFNEVLESHGGQGPGDDSLGRGITDLILNGIRTREE